MPRKQYTLRIEADLMERFHFACAYVDRSANKQLIQLVKGYISSYEKAHGKIDPEQLKEFLKKKPKDEEED